MRCNKLSICCAVEMEESENGGKKKVKAETKASLGE